MTTAQHGLNDQDFNHVRQLIYQRAGIKLGDNKRAMVVSRLGRRLRHLNKGDFASYLSVLDDPAADEWQFFTNALTTNLTAFFREAHHFDVLADFLRQRQGQDQVRIWCSAASTGEEPYSIMMTAAGVGRHGPRLVSQIASDVDTKVLEHAATGVYDLERVSKLDKGLVKRHFMRGTGPKQGLVKVKPALQKNLSFQQINLLSPAWPLKPTFDVIFCRNVMIYFDRDTQRRLLERMMGLLAPDGLFFAGHSESFYHCADLIRSIGRTIYVRADV